VREKIKKTQSGIVQIPILIAVLVIALIIGGGSYIGVKQYQKYKTEKVRQKELALKNQQQKDLEVEELKREIEKLKNQKPQIIKQTIIKEVPLAVEEISPPSTKSETSQEKIVLPSVTTVPNQNQTLSITEIVGHWRLFTTKLKCFESRESKFPGTGSGLVIKSADGSFKVLTNKHVVKNAIYCTIIFPGNYTNIFKSGAIYRGSSEDFATISLGNSSEYLKDLIAGDAYKGICSENQKPILGDEILILGYPGVGSQTDITITKGIVSGFEGNYYITDAKVEQGNSGGTAILVRYNCYFGIPTYGISGRLESLSRILDIWKVVGQF